MSSFDDSDTVTTRGRARATFTCMRRKPNQRRWVNCCQGLVAWLRASWRSTVIGWCSVVEQRPAVVHHPEDPVAEALVVVDQVEFVAPGGEHPAGPEAEGPRLGEAGRAHHPELEGGDRRRVEVGELAWLGDPEGVRLAVEIETRDRREPDALVDLGPGLAGEDLDRVAERDQLAGQVAGVDALAPAARIAPVDEEGDPQATRFRPDAGRCARGPVEEWMGPLTLCRRSPKLGMEHPGQAGT